MASAALGVLFLRGGQDLSCYFKSIEVQSEQDMLDNTALCATSSRTYQPGLAKRTVKGEGFYSYNSSNDALSIDKSFSDAFASSGPNSLITIGSNGFAAPGDVAWLLNTKQQNHNAAKVEVGQLIMTSFEAVATDDSTATVKSFAAGIWLMSQTVTGTVNASSYNNSAGSTGYLAQCHVTDASSLSSVTVKIQHSTNNSVWADLVTFTSFTANGSEQKYNTATSVNQYVRAIVSAFSGTSCKVSVAMKLGYTG